MSSQIEIANNALTLLGAARIISLSDDVKAARSITAMWNITLDAELRAHNWRFAIARAALPALIDVPTWGYDLQYQLPSDFLRMVQVDEYLTNVNSGWYISGDTSPFSIESGKILTNIAAPLKIKYIRQITDTTEFDSTFTEVFAIKLAIKICEDITNSSTQRQMLWDEYKIAMKMALKSNAIETAPSANADGDWTFARL